MFRAGNAHLALGMILAAAWPRQAQAATGDLDLTFGGTGKVTTPIGSERDYARAVALQMDGRIVVAGESITGANADFAVVRYNPDGTLDSSFGGTGKVTTPIGSSDEQAWSLALQADGKIVAAGESYTAGIADFAVVRYNEDGTLDSSFGGTGKVTTPIGSFDDRAISVRLQADGKIAAAGFSFTGSNADFAVVRYNPDGTLDSSFGGTGKVTTAIGSDSDLAHSTALQVDGKIVVAGGSAGNFAVLRYNPDGTLDSSFGGTGKVTTDMGSASDTVWAVALQADGKIVASGWSYNGDKADFAVARYNADGTLDSSLGGTGKVITPIGSYSDFAHSIALQADGKIVVAGGSSTDSSNRDFAVVRYNWDGMLDGSFGGTGKVTTSIGSSDDLAWSMALQADGRIVAAGASFNNTKYDFAVVRYEGGATCGDGTTEAGEQCDDGNALGDDCCSSTCQYDPVNSPCHDGDVCNGDETCGGAGICEPGIALDCDDGDLCTEDSCDPIEGCENPAEPATTCVDTWTKGSLLAKENVLGKERILAKLLNGPPLTQGDFGNPIVPSGTASTVCIYDDAGSLAGKLEVDRAGDQCAGSNCWRTVGPLGYRYKDKEASSYGVSSLTLLGGPAGKSKILLKAANNSSRGQTNLPTGIAAALSGSTSATVQMHGSDAPACFSTTLSTVVKDTGTFFKAK